MSDQFVERFGELSPGPRHPTGHPNDPSLSLYAPNGARRFNMEIEGSSAWAVSVKDGERAFRVDAKGDLFLPDGRALGKAPKLAARPAAKPIEDRLYGKPATSAKRSPSRPAPISDSDRLAKALYGKQRR